MIQNKISILSTRPLTAPTMEKAADLGVNIDVASFIETKNIINQFTAQKIKKFSTQDASVVFTSMNAAEAVIDFLRAIDFVPDWTIYSLGGVTHTILKDYFAENEIIADAINATQLAQLIAEDEPEEVIFFCGNQRREELPKMLDEEEIKVHEVVVYETIETPVKVDMSYSGILFFSPSAVKSFFSLNNLNNATVLFAIGATTATALRQHSTNKVLVGSLPNKEHLAESAMDYFLKQQG